MKKPILSEKEKTEVANFWLTIIGLGLVFLVIWGFLGAYADLPEARMTQDGVCVGVSIKGEEIGCKAFDLKNEKYIRIFVNG